MDVKHWRYFGLTTLSLMLSTPAASQERSIAPNLRTSVDYAQSVSSRPVEVYPAMFTRLGSWLLYPDLEVSETYDDNIYATHTNQIDDWITILKPRARLESNWNVHSMKLDIGGNIGFHEHDSSEDYGDYYLADRSRFDVAHGTALTADVLYRHSHEDRGSPGNLDSTTKPLTYNVLSGRFGIERSVSTISARIDLQIDDIQYDDAKQVNGDELDTSSRDRMVTDTGLKFSYTPTPDSEAYLSLRLNQVAYDSTPATGEPDRDNSGYSVTFGAHKTISALWIADGFLGYAPSYYASGTLEDITGSDAVVLGGHLLWNPTALTSVIANADRRTYQTTEAGASALVLTAASLRLEHKLTRSLLLTGGLGYSHGNYAGSSLKYDEQQVSFGVEYFFTKLASVGSNYSYHTRNMSDNDLDYDKSVFAIQIRVNY